MESNGLLRRWALAGVVLVAGLGAPATAPAQELGSATIIGTVVDDTKAVIPGATVTVTEASTGVLRTVVSDAQGRFRLPALPVGEYDLIVELEGFRPVNVSALRLLSGEVRNVGALALQVGTQAEEVTVTAEVTPVQVDSSARTGIVTADQLTNVQMRGRDSFGLLALVPGVQDNNLNRNFMSWRSGQQLTINGAPVQHRDIMIDGFSAHDEGGTGNALVNPNNDAIGEIQVITNGFTAENGRNMGGLINFITKSGTSRLRGSGWYNAQRDEWNANDFIRKRQGLPRPFERVNIAGYSVGGPVVLPKLLDSRTNARKLFFFLSQEFTDDARPSEIVRTNLPTELERRGDFSETRQSDGTIQPIIDPLSGEPFPGNVVPQDRIHPVGQALLNQLPTPNNILNPIPGEEFTSNSAYDVTPEHTRTNLVLRMDGVVNNNVRAHVTYQRDEDNNWQDDRIAPGFGWGNQFAPGWVITGTVTNVLSPTLVHEIKAGYGINRWGFEPGWDARDNYCENLGVCPPKLEPFGEFRDPPPNRATDNRDEFPFGPMLRFAGGEREGLAYFNPRGAGNNTGRVYPQSNFNRHFSIDTTLTKTAGSHTMKAGLGFEWLAKGEPGSADYTGRFNFGHSSANPLSTGNGYANALLGVFTEYTELTDRVDRDARHTLIEGFVQDTWKVTPRFTLDYGVRLSHFGAFYEARDMTAAFYPELYDPANAVRLYRPVCLDGRPGNEPCPSGLRRAMDPANPDVLLPFAFVGNVVPGRGDVVNGMLRGGPDGDGRYWKLPPLVAAPRVGFAWDLTGDGQTALRSSWGIFYTIPRVSNVPSPSQFIGNAPVTFRRTINFGTIDDIAAVAGGSGGVLVVENPVSADRATLDKEEYGLPRAYNFNVALQRDIGFHTTVEAAYVLNFITNDYRTIPLNSIPLYAFADPNNQFNGEAIDENFLRQAFPGMGAVDDVVNTDETLRYHALQLKVERRMSAGLQFGLAYTLGKGEGMQGYDPYTDQLGGEEALRARYWGPTEIDRRHILTANYSYLIPNPTPNTPVLSAVLRDWMVAGVTKFMSGRPVNPSCSSNNSGIANNDPSLTGITVRCMLTGAPIDGGFEVDPDPLLRVHFNPDAFAMAQPLSPTVGNFGNAPLNMLRQNSWFNWDVTLERQFPLQVLSPNARLRLQIQAYNLFNQVQLTDLDATMTFTGPNNSELIGADTGRYEDVERPRIIALQVRFEF